MNSQGSNNWQDYVKALEALATDNGLEFDPVDFEAVPDHFMMEVAVYGLPVRMPHWSFGIRYIHQLIQRQMGHSHVFEVVFPGNPGHAFLAASNGLAENVLVTAHVLGHADFSRNNALFQRSQQQVSDHIVEHAAGHARRIQQAIELYGHERVEQVLDAALALEQHIDMDQALHRDPYSTQAPEHDAAEDGEFRKRFEALDSAAAEPLPEHERAPTPPHAECDLLWFISQYGPELEGWERDIFLAVREESFYFQPAFATQIMNEGWASYWHARLLREADFIPQQAYIDAIKCHSDVVRPIAGDNQVGLGINPYHLGFSMWEHIIENEGLAAARRIRQSEDDFGFIRNHLSQELAHKLQLFRYSARRDGQIRVLDDDLTGLHEAILSPKYNFGAPSVSVEHLQVDGTLELVHDTATDGRGLDLDRSCKVLEYVHRIWRRPVLLHTQDENGSPIRLTAPEVAGPQRRS